MDHRCPPPPPPENPPEAAAASESHNPNDQNDPALHNFRALMMKLAIASSPSNSLTPSQNLIFEEKLLQCFPYLKAPDHPTYSWMIGTAIKKLEEEGGSSEEAISEYIMNNNSDLPWAHATLLRHHLGKLCKKGDIVQTRDGLYTLNVPITNVPVSSSPSNPSECFNASDSDSPSFSISSDSLYSDSDSPKRKRRRRKKLKKVGNKRMGRPRKRSVRKKNIHLKRKRKVRGNKPPKKVKRKGKISSGEEMEMEEETHQLEDVKENGRKQEVQELTNGSPCEEERREENMQMILVTDAATEEHNIFVEARNNVIKTQNEQKDSEMKLQSPLELEVYGQNDTLKEQIHMNEETKEMELLDLEVQERIVVEEQNQLKQLEVMEEESKGNQQGQNWKENFPPSVKNQLQEQNLMEELHSNKGDEQEDTKEKKMDLACEKDVLLEETDLLLQERTGIDEGQHELMQKGVVEQEYLLQPIETKDQEKEIVNSPISYNKDLLQVNIQQSMQTEAEIVQVHNSKEIIVLDDSDETEEAGERHEAVQTFIGSEEVSEQEETVDMKQNDQQEQETVACEEHSEEVEETTISRGYEVASEEEEQELQFPEETKQEQSKHRQLQRPRFPKIEPGSEEHQVLPLQATRRVTRQMTACISPLLDPQAPQQRNKCSKSQAGEISCMPRRSVRLSEVQSRK